MSETPIGDQVESEQVAEADVPPTPDPEAELLAEASAEAGDPATDGTAYVAENPPGEGTTISMTDAYHIPGEETSGEAEAIEAEDQSDTEDTSAPAAEDAAGEDPPADAPVEG